jgi:hypothetical protein
MKTPQSADTDFLDFLERLAYKAKGLGYGNILTPSGTGGTPEPLQKWADEALGKYELDLKKVREIWEGFRKSKVPLEKVISPEKCLDCLLDCDVIVNKTPSNARAIYGALSEVLPQERNQRQATSQSR